MAEASRAGLIQPWEKTVKGDTSRQTPPPFRPAIGPDSFQNRDQCLHRPGNGPGSSGKGNGPGSCGTTVPVIATNRDQCSGHQHVAHCEALVPTNRDLCPGYISPLASTLLKKFQ